MNPDDFDPEDFSNLLDSQADTRTDYSMTPTNQALPNLNMSDLGIPPMSLEQTMSGYSQSLVRNHTQFNRRRQAILQKLMKLNSDKLQLIELANRYNTSANTPENHRQLNVMINNIEIINKRMETLQAKLDAQNV